MLESAPARTARLVRASLDYSDVSQMAGGLQARMSGICAVWHKENPGRISDTLASLNGGLSLAPSERKTQESIEGVGVGVSAGFPNQQIWRDWHVMLACDTDLLNEVELAAT